MSNLFIITYILMAIFLYARMRAITSFSSLHCFFIALTSSIPFMIRMVVSSISLLSDLIVELGLLLGGTSSKEIKQELVAKIMAANGQKVAGDKEE